MRPFGEEGIAPHRCYRVGIGKDDRWGMTGQRRHAQNRRAEIQMLSNMTQSATARYAGGNSFSM
jgi:hypothetical protein